MGKKSRTKGSAYEREIANKMKAIWPDARRGGHDQSGPMGRPDVDGTPYWIEAKRYARVLRSTILNAFAQADAAADRASDDRPTLVVTRSDREQSQVHFSVVKVRPDTGGTISVIVSVPLSEWLAACEAKQ
jgi:hypothetical protein